MFIEKNTSDRKSLIGLVQNLLWYAVIILFVFSGFWRCLSLLEIAIEPCNLHCLTIAILSALSLHVIEKFLLIAGFVSSDEKRTSSFCHIPRKITAITRFQTSQRHDISRTKPGHVNHCLIY